MTYSSTTSGILFYAQVEQKNNGYAYTMPVYQLSGTGIYL